MSTFLVVFFLSAIGVLTFCANISWSECKRLKKENVDLLIQNRKFSEILLMGSPKSDRIGELIDSLKFVGITNSYTKREDKVITTVIEFGGLVEVREIRIEGYSLIGVPVEREKVELLYKNTLVKGMNTAQERNLLKVARNKLADKAMIELSYGPKLISSGSRKTLPQRVVL